jgi:hypothetical protein
MKIYLTEYYKYGILNMQASLVRCALRGLPKTSSGNYHCLIYEERYKHD